MIEREAEPLLPSSEAIRGTIQNPQNAAYRTLPVALLASLGMAATSATTIYAYADLLCKDQTACKDSEQSAYAAVVAMASGIAHAVAFMILGPMEQLIKTHLRAGLLIWIVCRATSVLCLVIGGSQCLDHLEMFWLTIAVSVRSVAIAVSGRIFEGLASDNLLHFNLNTIYVSLTSPPSGQETAQLITASLGLYMLGTAVGPLAVGVFQGYTASFTEALAIFSVALAYLVIVVRVPAAQAVPRTQAGSKILSSLHVLISPLRPFLDHPLAIPYGLSLVLYTTVQAHLFPAIMVFASIRLHFGIFQNGLLVSIAAACAAVHLLLKVFIVPSLQRLRPNSGRFTDSTAVLGALVIQMLALAAITQVRTAGQLYLAVSVAAAGLPLPAFFKSHFVSFMPDASRAITALTFMENLGGLMSPFVLGSWQSVAPGPSVFAFAVALLGIKEMERRTTAAAVGTSRVVTPTTSRSCQIQKHRWIGGNVSLAQNGLDFVRVLCCDFVCSLPVDNHNHDSFVLGRFHSKGHRHRKFAPWVKYRALNRIFKKEIEDYYFEHWINGSQIFLDCEETRPPDFPASTDLYVHEVYKFSGFRDSEKRIAVFEGQYLDWTDPKDLVKLIQMEKELKVFDEIGYNPYITFKIERGVTDLLPMDLRFRHTITRSYFTFDWRTYLSTLLDELRRVAEYEEQSGCKSQVELAGDLKWKTMHGEMEPLEAMLHLVRAAGTQLVGCDGRLLVIRRLRRCRLGVKTGKLRFLEAPFVPMNVLEHRFACLDEEYVANTLLGMAISSPVEW
ncbi:hypothetical protein CDV55_105758 [Aspergillus turcosus]|uniref:Uncharacterized protein n=1 Tax=Aspergillus turcosus TaxID=1245748 RepID=A0A397HTF8_9EURO|nr:hypothetical protein CDV55_105758 [Aspergillus turcosus]RLL98410.1 hypothetical protein CFD26_106017 [Aspergillus turcosus]